MNNSIGVNLLSRENDSHKNQYGHLLIVSACDTMPGAACLCTSAALKSGCGLVTLHSSKFACQVSAFNNPSAMLSYDDAACFSVLPENLSRFNAIAVGPGLGLRQESCKAFIELLDEARNLNIPMVIDADALNMLALHQELLDKQRIPSSSILTPHDGELRRLVGEWNDDAQKCLKAQNLSDKTGCVVVSKGYHSKIFIPGSSDFKVNSTGNPGMAKGGSGDVLTGLLGGLLARGYDAVSAAETGTWIHGSAGDYCSKTFGMEAYNSKDLADNIYQGFKSLVNSENNL